MAGLLLVLAWPLSLPPPAAVEHQLEVEATGRKSPSAMSSEVWLHGLVDSSGNMIAPAKAFAREGAWLFRDGVLISYEKQPAKLRWKGLLAGRVHLRLTSHPYSGIAKVVWDGKEQLIDLYSPTGPIKELLLDEGVNQPITDYVVLALCDGICVGFVLLTLTAWLITRPQSMPIAGRCGWAWLGYSAICASVWSYHLWVFWPGLLSPDSQDQWNQLLTWQFTNNHPVAHALTNWLVTRFWLSPAAVAIGQIIAVSVLVGWGLMRMRQWGLPRWLAMVTCGIVALMPANGTMVVTLWKDIPFSVAVLLLTFYILEMIASEGRWLEKRAAWILLGVVAALIALYRHNGPAVAFPTIIALSFVFRTHWRQLVLSLLLAVGLWWGVTGPLYRALGVAPTPSFYKLFPVFQQIALHTNRHTPFTAEEKFLLERLHPLQDGAWPCDLYNVQTLLVDGRFNHALVPETQASVLKLYFRLFWRNPAVVLEYLRENANIVWSIRRVPERPCFYCALEIREGRAYCMGRTRFDLPVDVWSQPTVEIARPLPKGLVAAISDQWSWLMWRPALYLYLLLCGVLVAAVRSGNGRYLCVAVPVVLQSASLTAFCPSPEFRYQWAPYLAGMLLTGFLLWGTPKGKRANDCGETGQTQEGVPGAG